MTMTLAMCRYCGTVCADDDTDTAAQLLADHQWCAHPEAVCGCGHVRAEHAAVDERLTGGCKRCGCNAFISQAEPWAQVQAARQPLTCAQLQARLDELGGTLNAACVNHVWSVVLTRDGVPVATARAADLVDALQRVVTLVDEVAGG